MDPTPPDLEQLTQLLDQLQVDPEAPPERRKYPRRLASGAIRVLIQTDDGHPPRTGTLRDMSRSGIGILLAHPLPTDSRFTFRATVGPKSVRATCRVANCRPDGRHGYIIGAQILEAPAPSAAPPEVDQLHVTDVARRLQTALADRR